MRSRLPSGAPALFIRDYRRDDSPEICRLFFETVREVNSKDHSEEQVGPSRSP